MSRWVSPYSGIENVCVCYRLSNADFLEHCLDRYTQNNNENLNVVIWSMAPKGNDGGVKIVETASHNGASIFNDGYTSVLQMM